MSRSDLTSSYLYSLQQEKQRLEREIQHATDNSHTPTDDFEVGAHSQQALEQDYHLNITHQDVLLSPSRTVYLGPGSMARLLERVLKRMVHWCLENNVPMPDRLLPDQSSWSIQAEHSTTVKSFVITHDPRKLELQSLVPASTQRALIDHYFKTVSSEYTFLPSELEPPLLVHENPLRWYSANKDEPGGFAMSIVFAISSTLVTRDVDSNLSIISTRCLEEVRMVAQRTQSLGDPIESTRWTCTALGALALCELINPLFGQLWDLLGKALSTLDDLRQEYELIHREMDDDFRRLERSLLKMESATALHFRRPSPFCAMRLRTISEEASSSGHLPDELTVASHLLDLAEKFTISPRPPESTFERLIPVSMQLTSINSPISIHSATLYTALHPLMTNSDAASKGILNDSSMRLFHVIAHSASAVIDHFARLDGGRKIISLWMAADRVLEAGLVWASYLMYHRITTPGYRPSDSIGTRVAMSPVLKVSALLASFSARWNSATAHVQAWETVVELLWSLV
ncbi:hypothetical protein A1O3_01344 [Capronia epimyces CBS 606.96]|uniref:Transcription factor domain-containing protein n=1 Tax=Capronia epimyces CBS 606.96 TaxID=1182542 RepID=W9YU48_9EURO|nr:uncharacterized protein A1O3_01344 [Capronia epimyces CBS 606.96]EXJ92791.1 hypothetical protein A1O3_01344 [Capronia epimyces CBS 606.96]